MVVRVNHSMADLITHDKGEGSASRLMLALLLAVPLLAFALSLTYALRPFAVSPYLSQAIHFAGFIVVALLVMLRRQTLRHYYIDKVSLITILLFAGFLGPVPTSAPIWFAATSILAHALVALFIWWRLRGSEILTEGRMARIIPYALLGLAVAVANQLITTRLQLPFQSLIEGLTLLGPLSAVDLFATRMGMVASIEEPIFRGFLLGYLIHDRGWNPHIAVVGQTILFWAPHIYQVGNPFHFWLALPMTGIMYGYLTLWTKSIAPAIFAHGVHEWSLAILDVVGAR